MASTTQSPSRGPILAALTGLVLLGILVAFTLGLNAADDGSDTVTSSTTGEYSQVTERSHTGGVVDLPEALPGDFVSVTSDAMPAGLVDQLGGRTSITDQLARGADGIAGLYGDPAGLAIYGHTDGTSLITVAVATTTAGLFMPDGLPPFDPADLGVARAQQVLENVDGAVCSVGYTDSVPSGQPVDQSEVPQQLTCQLGDGGRTYQLSGNGLGVDEAVTALKAVAAYVAGDDSAVPDVADLPPAPTAPATGPASSSGSGSAPPATAPPATKPSPSSSRTPTR